jgi:hypothetical protein
VAAWCRPSRVHGADVKKILLFVSIAAIAVFAVVSATDPNVKRRVQEKTQAEAREKDRKREESQEAWRKWMEDGKRKTDERVKQANEPGFDDGFRLGFMGGKLTRSQTTVAPSSATVDRLSREQLDKQNVAAESHAGFVRGFKAGWSAGWTSK